MDGLMVFLAVVIFVVAVNGFLYVLMKAIIRQMKGQAATALIKHLDFMDQLYAEKEADLLQLQEEADSFLGHTSAIPAAVQIRQAQQQAKHAKSQEEACFVPSAVETYRKTRYRDGDLLRTYRYIRENFAVDSKAVVEDILREQPRERGRSYGELCQKMYQDLTGEVTYQLSLLPEEQQQKILKAAYDGEEQRIWETFFTQNPNTTVITFRDYLKTEADLNREKIQIRTADPMLCEQFPDLDVIVDDAITEGVQIVCGNKLYDYSI